MAHMIDETNAAPAIAYRGDVPWHGLGATIGADDDLATIGQKAGLSHMVRESIAQYDSFMDGDAEESILRTVKPVPDRKVLWRSDSRAPLAVVSKDYKVVQPMEVLAFFDEMVKSGGFSIETAGALSGGKRVWANARIGPSANVIGQDSVTPFILLATSYDASMATVCKFVYERTVCHNTITAALGENGKEVKVYHSQQFDAARVRQDMGVALNAFEAWVIKARLLATLPLPDAKATELTEALLLPYTTMDDVTKSRGFQSVMTLFKGAAIGSGLTQGGTAWQWLNAVTEHTDWSRGRSADNRVNSAWFGEGDAIKTKAQDMVLELVA